MWFIGVTIMFCLIKGLVGLSNPSIVIVGSGSSGIAAATKLLKNNFTDIIILEAENRIGGRIYSIKFGDAYIDIGAQFCHGQENSVVYELVKDLNILKPSPFTTSDMLFYLPNGELVANSTGQKIIEFTESLKPIGNSTEEICSGAASLGECLDIRFKSFRTSGENAKENQILSSSYDWIKSFKSGSDSPLDLNDLMLKSNYVQAAGDLHMHWNGHGYKTILEVMVQKYPNKEHQLPIDDKILLGKKVKHISDWQNDDKVTVTTVDGSSYQADHVIFTPSIGVLKEEQGNIFNPALPQEKISAINNTGYGVIMKVFLHFAERWWEKDAFWGFIWTQEDKAKLKEIDLEWLIDVYLLVQGENNSKVLIAWCGGSYIPQIETIAEQTVLEGHEYLIKKFLAPHFNVTMPDQILRITWYTNPNFRGTYSYESVKGHAAGGNHFPEKIGRPLINKKDKPTVLFAGEATHPYYYSTVHGAIETGYREADRLINLYRNNNLSVL